jgi:hypothetical protein
MIDVTYAAAEDEEDEEEALQATCAAAAADAAAAAADTTVVDAIRAETGLISDPEVLRKVLCGGMALGICECREREMTEKSIGEEWGGGEQKEQNEVEEDVEMAYVYQ